jgi:hypothetical protein
MLVPLRPVSFDNSSTSIEQSASAAFTSKSMKTDSIEERLSMQARGKADQTHHLTKGK